jgi:hypothetical protein
MGGSGSTGSLAAHSPTTDATARSTAGWQTPCEPDRELIELSLYDDELTPATHLSAPPRARARGDADRSGEQGQEFDTEYAARDFSGVPPLQAMVVAGLQVAP